MRADPWGTAVAWTVFTLPSAIALVLFASGSAVLDGPISQGIIHGLKVTAVAIVAHAVWGMARSLCPDSRRAGIAVGALGPDSGEEERLAILATEKVRLLRARAG